MIRIKSIFISNFRSIAEMKIDNLSTINIFVGPNGSGKSNLFNALRSINPDLGQFNSMGTYSLENNSHKGLGDSPKITVLDNKSREINNDPSLAKGIYAIGLPRKFSEFNDRHKIEIENLTPEQDRTYAKICRNWQKIREDAERIGITLRKSKPAEPVVPVPPIFDWSGEDRLGPVRITIARLNNENTDRFFYDVLDDYGVPILEGSDGIASFLLIIVKIRSRDPGSVIIIEEPEVAMHPGLQKDFLDYLKYLAKEEYYQFLVSTHSPYLMNLAVQEETGEDKVAIFRLLKDAEGFTQIIKPMENKRAENWEILTDLGHSPADILQVNGVIWVEGPSDLIYVKAWLKKLAPDLHRGKDYEILPYGGSNFIYLGVEETEQIELTLWENEETPKTLLSLFGLSQNWAFLVDSDSHLESHDCQSVRESNRIASQRKDKLIQDISNISPPSSRDPYFTWKVDPYIEKCISGWDKTERKVKQAHDYENYLKEPNTDCKLINTAQVKVQELIDKIRKWK